MKYFKKLFSACQRHHKIIPTLSIRHVFKIEVHGGFEKLEKELTKDDDELPFFSLLFRTCPGR